MFLTGWWDSLLYGPVTWSGEANGVSVELSCVPTLASGEALQPNHLYLITADGWGLSASADATVLVRGSCTVG